MNRQYHGEGSQRIKLGLVSALLTLTGHLIPRRRAMHSSCRRLSHQEGVPPSQLRTTTSYP